VKNKKSLELPKSVENFARGLLATTCLTAACGSSAWASTVTLTEGAQETAPGALLPTGTNIVDGFIVRGVEGAGSADWFEFQGLTPGSNYTLTGAYDPLGPRMTSANGETGLRMSVFTDTLTPLFTDQSLESAGASVMGTIPSDGNLEVEIYTRGVEGVTASAVLRSFANVEGSVEGGQFGSSYQVQLIQTAEVGSTVPEPANLTTAGLALAGALAWSRKRRQ
jgi:hypothetical protein